MPYYTQKSFGDSRLLAPNAGSSDYANTLLKDYGCGPAALAMVASKFNQTNIDPSDTAKYITDSDLTHTGTQGVKPSFFEHAAKHYHLSMQPITSDTLIDSWNHTQINPAEKIALDLSAGRKVIIGGNSGGAPFSHAGHYVVLYKAPDADGNVYLYDPDNSANNSKKWSLNDLVRNSIGFNTVQSNGGFAASF